MTPILRIIACTIAGILWLAALVAKHFWPDIDIALFAATCAGVIGALGIHGMTSGSASPAKEGGFASVRVMVALAAVALGLAMLGGCATATRAWVSGAEVEVKNANDNALALWKSAGCAMPVGAILRDPDAIESVNRFCGGPKTQLGATNAVPAAAAASGAK